MILFSLIGFLVGAALGQRFSVIVLVPAIVIFSGLAMVAEGAARSGWSMVVMAVTTAICLQIGYFVGICIRYLLQKKSRARMANQSYRTAGRDVAAPGTGSVV
jgi:hypothetical protein